jgi:hypothetical protein
LIRGLLDLDESRRLGASAIGAEEIKQHPWFAGIDWECIYYHAYQAPFAPFMESEDDTRNFGEYPVEEELPLEEPIDPALFAGF